MPLNFHFNCFEIKVSFAILKKIFFLKPLFLLLKSKQFRIWITTIYFPLVRIQDQCSSNNLNRNFNIQHKRKSIWNETLRKSKAAEGQSVAHCHSKRLLVSFNCSLFHPFSQYFAIFMLISLLQSVLPFSISLHFLQLDSTAGWNWSKQVRQPRYTAATHLTFDQVFIKKQQLTATTKSGWNLFAALNRNKNFTTKTLLTKFQVTTWV